MAIPPTLNGQWIGDLNGTLVGQLYVEFRPVETSIDVQFGANIRGEPIELRGRIVEIADRLICKLSIYRRKRLALPTAEEGDSPEDPKPSSSTDVEPYAELVFDTVQSNRIAGRWETIDGNRGVFQLGPANTETTPPIAPESINPLQIVSRREDIPKLRLSRNDILDLVSSIKRSLPSSNDVAVAFAVDNNEIVQLSEDFFQRRDLPKELNYLRLTINDQSPGIKKSIQVTFSDKDSHILVSASDEVWVSGVTQNLLATLHRRSSWYSWWFQKHGLNLNGVLLLVTIGLLPNLQMTARFVFIFIVVLALLGFQKLHTTVSKVKILPREDTLPPSKVSMGEIVTGAVGGIGTILAIAIFDFLSGDGLTKLLVWMSEVATGN